MTAADDRQQRLAAALRENLKRRKQQARELATAQATLRPPADHDRARQAATPPHKDD